MFERVALPIYDLKLQYKGCGLFDIVIVTKFINSTIMFNVISLQM